MPEPATPAPSVAGKDATGRGCGFQVFSLLLVLGLLVLFHYLGWWPRERGWLTGMSFWGVALLAGGLAVALAAAWDKLRNR